MGGGSCDGGGGGGICGEGKEEGERATTMSPPPPPLLPLLVEAPGKARSGPSPKFGSCFPSPETWVASTMSSENCAMATISLCQSVPAPGEKTFRCDIICMMLSMRNVYSASWTRNSKFEVTVSWRPRRAGKTHVTGERYQSSATVSIKAAAYWNRVDLGICRKGLRARATW